MVRTYVLAPTESCSGAVDGPRNPAGSHRSEAPPPQIDRVVDLQAPGVLAEDALGDGGGQLDAHDGLQVLAAVEGPRARQSLSGPAVRRPEALDVGGGDLG